MHEPRWREFIALTIVSLRHHLRLERRRNWLGETHEQQVERRLAACESNLQNIWEHLNAGNTGNG